MKHIKLFESFQSQQELSKLADMILQKIIENSIDEKPVEELANCDLSEISSLEFKDLKQFINNDKLLIVLADEDEFGIDDDVRAKYIITKDKYNYIFLKDNIDLIKRFNEYIEERKQYMLLSLMQGKYKTHLIHELQHAYDYFRSDGKAIKIPDANVIPENISDEELFLLKSKFVKEYLNLKYEVDARFTQAIDKIQFTELDIKSYFEINILLPFEKVVKSFKRNMANYKLLSDEDKKRCLRKLGQFYEIIKSSYTKNGDSYIKKYDKLDYK